MDLTFHVKRGTPGDRPASATYTPPSRGRAHPSIPAGMDSGVSRETRNLGPRSSFLCARSSPERQQRRRLRGVSRETRRSTRSSMKFCLHLQRSWAAHPAEQAWRDAPDQIAIRMMQPVTLPATSPRSSPALGPQRSFPAQHPPGCEAPGQPGATRLRASNTPNARPYLTHPVALPRDGAQPRTPERAFPANSNMRSWTLIVRCPLHATPGDHTARHSQRPHSPSNDQRAVRWGSAPDHDEHAPRTTRAAGADGSLTPSTAITRSTRRRATSPCEGSFEQRACQAPQRKHPGGHWASSIAQTRQALRPRSATIFRAGRAPNTVTARLRLAREHSKTADHILTASRPDPNSDE